MHLRHSVVILVGPGQVSGEVCRSHTIIELVEVCEAARQSILMYLT